MMAAITSERTVDQPQPLGAIPYGAAKGKQEPTFDER